MSSLLTHAHHVCVFALLLSRTDTTHVHIPDLSPFPVTVLCVCVSISPQGHHREFLFPAPPHQNTHTHFLSFFHFSVRVLFAWHVLTVMTVSMWCSVLFSVRLLCICSMLLGFLGSWSGTACTWRSNVRFPQSRLAPTRRRTLWPSSKWVRSVTSMSSSRSQSCLASCSWDTAWRSSGGPTEVSHCSTVCVFVREAQVCIMSLKVTPLRFNSNLIHSLPTLLGHLHIYAVI